MINGVASENGHAEAVESKPESKSDYRAVAYAKLKKLRHGGDAVTYHSERSAEFAKNPIETLELLIRTLDAGASICIKKPNAVVHAYYSVLVVHGDDETVFTGVDLFTPLQLAAERVITAAAREAESAERLKAAAEHFQKQL